MLLPPLFFFFSLFERERNRRGLPSAHPTPQMPMKAVTGPSRSQEPEFNLGPLRGSPWTQLPATCCHPRCTLAERWTASGTTVPNVCPIYIFIFISERQTKTSYPLVHSTMRTAGTQVLGPPSAA